MNQLETTLADEYGRRSQWVNTDTGEIVDLPGRAEQPLAITPPQLARIIHAARAGERVSALVAARRFREAVRPRHSCGTCRWRLKLWNEAGWLLGLVTLAAVALVGAGGQLLG
jgi:hypothetical protein